MQKTNDVHVIEAAPIVSPEGLKGDLPICDAASELVHRSREEVRAILRGKDRRALAIVGPCSVHDPSAALTYAERLLALRRRFEDDLILVMRVYFEKPRTTVGWKGLVNDPHLNQTHDISAGLRIARGLLLDVAKLGMPAATEMLDPIVPQYIADLVTWTAIGARTTESQTHREMASGLSMPVGYKNGTDGGIEVAINALLAAARPHSFLGIDGSGRVAIVRTRGNPDGHIVLRGGSAGPNYSAVHLSAAAEALARAGVQPRLLVDCSHGNSGKSHAAQATVVGDVARQIAYGSPHVLGLMIESNLVAGRQDLRDGMRLRDLVRGQSITDACVDLETTELMLAQLARAVSTARSAASVSLDLGAQILRA